MHNADSHIHVVIKETNKITEVSSPDIFEYIKQHDEFKELDVEYVRITVGARKKK